MIKLLFIYQDPTPYNIDLFNELSRSALFKIEVIYTVKRDSSEGAHKYSILPEADFDHIVLNGSTFDIARILKKLKSSTYDHVILMGYSNKLIALTMLILKLKGLTFIAEADGYRLSHPVGRLSPVKRAVRDYFRGLTVERADLLLCAGGVKGRREASAIGFETSRILDFPYTVSKSRIANDTNDVLHEQLSDDIESDFVILVSARFIERKGHREFLQEVSKLGAYDFRVWLEGEGPLLQTIKDEADSLGLASKVRFLGFCQMDVHNWLLSRSDIVIVPSLSDPWGIVVDEAMKAEKVVISTIYTGSAVDRIKDGANGFIYDPLEPGALVRVLSGIFEGRHDLLAIQEAAKGTGDFFDCAYNRINLEQGLEILRSISIKPRHKRKML